MKIETAIHRIKEKKIESIYALFDNEDEYLEFNANDFATEWDAEIMEWDDGVASYYGYTWCQIFHREIH